MRKTYNQLCAFPLRYAPFGRVSLVFLLALLFGSLQLKAQMSGTYTVCPSGCNYSTVNAALSDLKTKGISGPVTVNISADQYNETLSFTAITGSSATNTITFKGAGKYKTRLYNNGTQVISITTGKYLIFKDMAIEQTGTTATKYAVYMSSTTNNTFDNCIIAAPIATTSGMYALYATSCSNNIYSNNIIKGGYYTVYNYQYSTTYAFGGDLFENNRITQSQYYGMYTYGGLDNTYKRNYIDSTGYYALYSYYEGSAYYEGNILPGLQGSGTVAPYYIINMNYPNYYGGTGYLEFYNNMIGSESTPAYYAHYLYAYGYNNIKYKHNTIHKGNTTGYNLYFYGSTASNNFELKNNNLTRTGSGTLLYYPYQNNTHSAEGNNYYPSTGSNLIYYNLKYFSSVADYQVEAKKLGFDQFATSVMPTYKSGIDLHLDPAKPAPNNRYAGIDKDIDGDDRCKSFATVGADETSYGKTTIAKAGFSGPDTVIVGSPTNFFNTASVNDPNNFKYYINNVFAGDSIHLRYVSTSTGTVTIKLVTESCAGKDSVTKTVHVVNPTAKPSARFISNVSTIVQGEVVRFTDISRNGASSWKWDITPDSTFDVSGKSARYKFLYNTSATSQNPVLQFLVSGKYKVCLTATNNLGSNTLCRADYISVQTSFNIGSIAVSTDSAGYIYDNGGKDGDYTSSFKGSTLLAPCAEKIYLIVKKFDTECNYDYLRVFDGADNKGTPLHRCLANINGANGPGFVGGPSSNTCANYCMPSLTDTFVAKSGKMFLEFQTDASGTFSGFELYYWSKPKAQPKPTASFTTMSDSVCINKPLSFTNTSTGDDIKYFWDLDNDLTTFESTTKNAIWPYYATGT
ncbi:MAG: hypothetical protein EOP47_22490, partial [Sphingobacteriaceae bacterium]